MLVNREMYSIKEAAHLLDIRPATLRWWLEGRDHHPPVLRTEPSGSPNVTWGEFVEARFLREYRKHRSLQRLRPVIERLRQEFGVEHPLAHLKPFVGPGLSMTLAAQTSAGLAYELAVVHEIATGQLILSFKAEDFIRLIEFHPDGDQAARRIRPRRSGLARGHRPGILLRGPNHQRDQDGSSVRARGCWRVHRCGGRRLLHDPRRGEGRLVLRVENRRTTGPALVRYYFDADVLGLAKVVTLIRPDATYAGDPGGVVRSQRRDACPITTPAAKDVDWIPVVARRGWSIITQDRRIAGRPAERAAVMDNRAKLFRIGSRKNLDVWGQLEVLLTSWRNIGRLSQDDGPYIYVLHRTRFRRIP